MVDGIYLAINTLGLTVYREQHHTLPRCTIDVHFQCETRNLPSFRVTRDRQNCTIVHRHLLMLVDACRCYTQSVIHHLLITSGEYARCLPFLFLPFSGAWLCIASRVRPQKPGNQRAASRQPDRKSGARIRSVGPDRRKNCNVPCRACRYVITKPLANFNLTPQTEERTAGGFSWTRPDQ
jgi:hypothetical protein